MLFYPPFCLPFFIQINYPDLPGFSSGILSSRISLLNFIMELNISLLPHQQSFRVFLRVFPTFVLGFKLLQSGVLFHVYSQHSIQPLPHGRHVNMVSLCFKICYCCCCCYCCQYSYYTQLDSWCPLTTSTHRPPVSPCSHALFFHQHTHTCIHCRMNFDNIQLRLTFPSPELPSYWHNIFTREIFREQNKRAISHSWVPAGPLPPKS